MTEIVELGRADGRLCGTLAAAVARFLTRSDGQAGPGRQGAAFYHESAPAFEAATRVLRDLNLVARVPRADRPEEAWYCLHALAIDAAAMPGHLATLLPGGDPRVADMLVAFLRIACEFDGLSTARSPFSPPAAYAAALRALASAGYAEPVGDAFAWTGRIAPAMRRAGTWDEACRSRAALAACALDAQAEAAWRTMPQTVRRAHFSHRPVGVVALVETLARCWRDGAWKHGNREAASLPAGHVALARRLIALADGRP